MDARHTMVTLMFDLQVTPNRMDTFESLRESMTMTILNTKAARDDLSSANYRRF